MMEALISVAVIFILMILNTNGEDHKQYHKELALGDMADLMGTNQHHFQPQVYKDFSRRFVPQYPYVEVNTDKNNELDNEVVPELAPATIVLNIARQSAKLAKATPPNPSDELIQEHILRTGEYWNGVWQENGISKKSLRNEKKKKPLNTVKVNIMPDNKYYNLMSRLQKISPRLLYIVNKNVYLR